MPESFDFDLTLIEIPVTVGGNKYVLREADEETASMFNNARLKGIPVKDSEAVGLPEDLGGLQSLLVTRCLFPIDSSGEPLPSCVRRDTVKKWPARVVKPLYIKAKKISELDDKEDLESLKKQRDDVAEKIKELEEVEEETKND